MVTPAIRRKLEMAYRNAYRRCNNPAHPQYPRYGGRGIQIEGCLMRKDSFVQYLTTLPGHDDPALTLDREDNERGYERGNLRFVSRQVQSNNRENTVASASVKTGDIIKTFQVIDGERRVKGTVELRTRCIACNNEMWQVRRRLSLGEVKHCLTCFNRAQSLAGLQKRRELLVTELQRVTAELARIDTVLTESGLLTTPPATTTVQPCQNSSS